MNLQRRSYKKELLDSANLPFSDIKKNMEELEFINTYLGGHKISITGFKKLLKDKKQIHVCEIGCGGGDNLFAILNWCNKHNIKINFTAIDINQSCIEFAMTREILNDKTKWLISDYRTINFENKPDIIFSSLFCHHFTNEELVEQSKWMRENSSIGFFINDLQRNSLAYYSIKFLTKIFSKSYLVKNDAPLSVARGFIKKEWKNILNAADIKSYQIQWRWAFRYLIIYFHERN
ncbi:MAG: methyltransferase domain-containing protein [Chitinophagaceae bacterium]